MLILFERILLDEDVEKKCPRTSRAFYKIALYKKITLFLWYPLQLSEPPF